MNFRFFIFAILSISAIQNTMAATINLQLWNKETNTKTAAQCTIGGTIGTLPSAPKKTGYKFTGWKVQKYDTCSLCGMNSYTNGTSYSFSNISGFGMGGDGEALSRGEFIVNFQDGSKIRGKALCSSKSGGNYSAGIPDETTSGNECWCKATQRVSTNGTPCNTTFSSWIRYGTSSSCASECSYKCADIIKTNYYFRNTMYFFSDLRNLNESGSITYYNDYGSSIGGFEIKYKHGTVIFKTLCSNSIGTYAKEGTPNETSPGQYCWCRADKYLPTNCDSDQEVVFEKWIFSNNAGSKESCIGSCKTYCSNTINGNSSFRGAVYGKN